MPDTDFDLIVIGAGPGGYVAAIKAAQLGMKVACVDKRETLGGTCLNVGCIPSKALLESTHRYAEAADGLAAHGVTLGKVGFDLAAMMARKDKVVADNVKGIDFLFRKNEVTRLTGTARIAAPGQVVVNGAAEPATYAAKNILIATGSEPSSLPGIEIDETRIVSSTGALALSDVPKKMVVVGAGYIGLEMGSVWARLGAEVTVVEFLDRVLPGMDGEVGKMMHRLLERQGLAFKLSTKVAAASAGKDGVDLALEPAEGGTAEPAKADVVLVAVGRRPYTDGLGLEEVGVRRDNRGFITVDQGFATGVPGIYAIGDVIPGPMLAHKAEDEGVVAVERMAAQGGHIDYNAIPGVVYTAPEAASVGKTEEQLKEAGTAYRAGKFPFSANSRARAMGETDGFVKILADAATDRVLGAHIIGPDAGTMISELALAMEFAASAEDIARTSHPHPTLSEAVREAAFAAWTKPIHA